jgi:cephalosporin-C deacetylase-like acetyl esterase
MRNALASVLFASLASATLFAIAPESNPQVEFNRYLSGLARADLAARETTIQAIETRTQAEQRRAQVRETVLRLIGGLPDKPGPLHAQSVGTLHEDGFHVERLIYDSLPNFHVTADLYVPDKGKAPYPAILYTPGHSPAGKIEAWLFSANMARNGVAVLAYDPIGEGERLQYFDTATEKSLAGGPTGEHSEASVQAMLTGNHIARYFVEDAMRGIDYLRSRQDIDATRIGAMGCSGGGTVTAYLAALDPRVKAAGVACYITGFDELLSSIGPQEAEQTLPGFISDGLSFPDWIEMAAPTPYAVISTTEDMFPFAGARKSVDEARRIYGLYDAGDRLQWITGPGRHGNLRPIYPQIMGFFLHWLTGSTETPMVEELTPPPAQDLLCTKTGQVASSLGGATVASLNRAYAPAAKTKLALTTTAQLEQFREHIAHEVRAELGLDQAAGPGAPQVIIASREQKTGYRLQTLRFVGTAGVEWPASLAIPDSEGKKPAILLLSPEAPSEDELGRLAAEGNIVLALELPPGVKDAEGTKSPLLGPFYMATLRAMLVGKTLAGMRVADVLRAVEWLSTRPEVDVSRLSAQGAGPMGIVLLHAAVLEPRIQSITLDRTLVSYRNAVEEPVTRDLAQSVIPGVLQHYDLDDLVMAVAPRTVVVTEPLDAAGKTLDADAFRRQYAWVFASDRKLHQADQLRIAGQQPAATKP